MQVASGSQPVNHEQHSSEEQTQIRTSVVGSTGARESVARLTVAQRGTSAAKCWLRGDCSRASLRAAVANGSANRPRAPRGHSAIDRTVLQQVFRLAAVVKKRAPECCRVANRAELDSLDRRWSDA